MIVGGQTYAPNNIHYNLSHDLALLFCSHRITKYRRATREAKSAAYSLRALAASALLMMEATLPAAIPLRLQ